MRHHVPAEQVLQHQRAGIEAEGHLRHDADHQHQARKEAPGQRVVAHFQELGDGEDLVADVIREKDRRGDAQAHRRGQLHRAGREPVAIRVAGQPDQVFGPDIGRIERQADDPPGQVASGEKEVELSLPAPTLRDMYQPNRMLPTTANEPTSNRARSARIPCAAGSLSDVQYR